MNIVERARAFVHGLWHVANRSAWDWRRCPHCEQTQTCKHGTYMRRPWLLTGRHEVAVQRHRCYGCRRTYSETSALLVRGGWYAREVRRCAIDHWQHGGSSLRRTAEILRSWLGRQERWLLWCPVFVRPIEQAECHLSASSIQRWLDRVADHLAAIPTGRTVGTDGLWARLRGKTTKVVLALGDSASGLLWPPVVADNEEKEGWAALFDRAAAAGLDVENLLGVVSDGTAGLAAYLATQLRGIDQQRCVFHLWQNASDLLRRQLRPIGRDLARPAARALRRQVRAEVRALIHGVLDAPTVPAATAALATLAAHVVGGPIAQLLQPHLAALTFFRRRYNRGLHRVAPEWLWRDFRLRLSHGRNHGSAERLERAALVWAIYRNFTPAQERSERQRTYRRSGKSPLEMAGVPPNGICYLDALGI